MQPAIRRSRYVYALAGVQLFHADHGGRADPQRLAFYGISRRMRARDFAAGLRGRLDPRLATLRTAPRAARRTTPVAQAQRRPTQSGLPIVRPLFLVEPGAPAAWSNWWTYQYGPDLLVSPIWEKGRREQEVYLPSGAQVARCTALRTRFIPAARPITVHAELAPAAALRPRQAAAVAKVVIGASWIRSGPYLARPPSRKRRPRSQGARCGGEGCWLQTWQPEASRGQVGSDSCGVRTGRERIHFA